MGARSRRIVVIVALFTMFATVAVASMLNR